jgi:hypothetical protein
MPYPGRSYIGYVDDSGSENFGWLWTGLALPADLWGEYLGRWLKFRQWLYNVHRVPASFELHAQAWLATSPIKEAKVQDQLGLVQDDNGQLISIMERGKQQRRTRIEAFEKGLKTIGTFAEARVFTAASPGEATGPAKIALYDDLLCMIEASLAEEGAHLTLMVDGAHDGGGHLRSAHRALLIKHRRIVEDAGLRRSSESQLLQMADCCAYAAFQSLQDKPTLDERFHRNYEEKLTALIYRPPGVEEGRAIRGLDYPHDRTGFPSERRIP